MQQYKILKLLFLSLLIYYLYKNTTNICRHVFMYDERDKNNNLQTNSSIKYISNTYGGVMQNEIYCN